jgi:two-component system OmpR family sensor kinase/two-component system phosphate regulon sensor histidine kinase PhoR
MKLRIKTTYRQRISGYFLLIILLFAAGVILIERRQERIFRQADLEARLDGYTEIIHEFITQNRLDKGSIGKVNDICLLMPEPVRISVIGEDGDVWFDNEVHHPDRMDNHLDRPEIMNARYASYGSNLRISASTRQEYLYYARFFRSCYVRVALPYTMETRNMLKADNLFVYMIVALFAVALIFIHYVAGRFSKSILQLKKFSSAIQRGQQNIPESIRFRDDELGAIGNELLDIFRQMENSKKKLEIEREKLIRHFRFSGEGLCIFSPEMKKIYANTNFIQYINLMTDQPTFDAEDIWKAPVFKPVADFVRHREKGAGHTLTQIHKNGKTFALQSIVFEDGSFEIIIKDVSKAEKTRLMKQEMTSNIAHELRTPVASLRGYLETLNSRNLDASKQKLFIERAFLQTIRLSNLIDDVSIISKIEEAPSQFAVEEINLAMLINDVRIDLSDKLAARHILFVSSIPDSLSVTGNYTLLYSIFRNLADNSICYAGRHIEIHISRYAEDEHYFYFSYYDTGIGVKEEHLGRLFERFYRINEGRTRDTGGSGLGLSIVRNAILFHKGDIQVKNRINGGLEFLFTLKK